MTLLLPVKRYQPDLYYKIEGLFFHWLLSLVAMWSYTAGYDGKYFRFIDLHIVYFLFESICMVFVCILYVYIFVDYHPTHIHMPTLRLL